MSWTLKLSPVKCKRDCKDPAKCVGDATYDYARLLLLKWVREAKEHAHQQVASESVDAADDKGDGWESDNEASSSRLDVEVELPQAHDLEDGKDKRLDVDTPTPMKPHCMQPKSLPVILVENGLFPTSPWEPHVAVSINLLNLYQSLLEHLGTLNSAFCSALQDIYVSHGFWMLDAKGVPMQEPFRHGFGYATKWYGCVRLALEDKIDSMLSNSCAKIPNSFATPNDIQPSTPAINVDNGSVSVLLVFLELALDRAFLKVVMSMLLLTATSISVTEHQQETAHTSMTSGISSPSMKLMKLEFIPDIAVDEDEKSFDAANEKKEKTHGGHYNDTGLAVLVCHHDVPLFLANVDTPGEQQKYAVALIDKLASHLPAAASIAVLYDIGCVMDQSINLYDIFLPMLTERLVFATSVMHSYGHQWACQLVYNPRLTDGLGLTDGKGVEQFWSCLWKLIDAPARLKKELDAILMLQVHVDTVESAIQATQTALKSSPMTVSQLNFNLLQLSYVHQQLCNQIDQLYASLNVSQSFPELASLNITFVQMLLLACNLKMNIHKRAVGTFFEWDQLDQEQSFTNKHENQSVAASQLSLQLFGSSMDNLLTWFEWELVALQISLQNIEADSPFLFPLKRRYEQTCALQHQWKNPLVSDMRWHAIVQSALWTAHSICHGISSSAIHFISPTIVAVPGIFSDMPGQTFTSILREFESDYDDEDNGDTISNDESDCLADILDDLDPSLSPSDVTCEVPSYSENDTISVTSSADDSESFKCQQPTKST
ncbi:uncharacterized protein EV420DRAFT_1726806 [Desarmillaria tabescens]|uniref:Uncharacterized protein n=1 Tax=Armillaria tabescens TaxID=1929756 RepID=A0AA39JHA6_ARMTA|nr:uncharacterized protein EV420DRAFT_1726806 [Desarmillaria tabescens]KAK0442762.1 hypothetical protein EV420DRAFT_1726806 [Desarmillaria tabescens]